MTLSDLILLRAPVTVLCRLLPDGDQAGVQGHAIDDQDADRRSGGDVSEPRGGRHGLGIQRLRDHPHALLGEGWVQSE